ncbi:MAG: serine/threonine-protein kinase [Planctomycetota bacterium]
MTPQDEYDPLESPTREGSLPQGAPPASPLEAPRTGETVFELDAQGEVRAPEPDGTTSGSGRSSSGSRKSGLRTRRRGSASGSGSTTGRVPPQPDPDSTDPLVGEELDGRYRLLEPLGQGGMAAVYKAWHLMLERYVAIKLIRRDAQDNVRFRERFFREAEISTAMVHPNVVQVRDFGETEGGTFYMVMDYCPGRTLKAALEEDGPFEPRRAAEVASEVLSALGQAHAQDVVHRDVKPENVILEPSGRVKVLDFGLAKVLRADDGEDEGMTRLGAVLGTPKYMSPEQAAGEPCDARCDLYSTGVVLYELLTGALPFDASNSDDMIQAHLGRQPTPLRERLHGLTPPPELEAIVSRALAKKPGERWQSAEDMEQALRDFLDDALTDVGEEVRESDFSDERPIHLASLPEEVSLARVVDTREDVEGFRFVVTPDTYRRDRQAEFVNQIEIAGRISHPALAAEVEAGGYPGGRFYAFVERSEGPSLHARISEGPLPLDVWYRHAKALLAALAKAHDFGTTHLAISSELVSLTPEGPVLHGLGVAAAAQSGWANPTNDVQDLAFLLLQMLAGAHVDEVGIDLVRQAGFAAAPEPVRPVLEKALGASPFPHAGALLRALQIVDPAFQDAPPPSSASLPAIQPTAAPTASASSPALVIVLALLVVLLTVVVVIQALT